MTGEPDDGGRRRAGAPARKWITTLMLAAVTAIVVGCSRETRYEILTFFFTGVPPLEGEGQEAAPERGPAADAGLSLEQRRAQILEQRRLAFQAALKWTHGPYGSGECDRCHSVAGSVAFRAIGADTGKAARQPTATRRLVMPREELCLTCHAEKSVAAADALDVRLHGPVASGLCVACHSPHQSPRRYMLLGADNVEMCTQCHEKAGIWERTPVHGAAADPDCLGCHNPHMGRSAMILRSEFDEYAERWGRAE